MSDEKKPTPITPLKPVAEYRAPEPKAEVKADPPKEPVDWRIELRHTPAGAFARRVRTQNAATALEAWNKFVTAVTADMKQAKTQDGQNCLQLWEEWLRDEKNKPKPPDAKGIMIPGCLRVITEEQAVAELQRSQIAPPAEMKPEPVGKG